MVPVGTIGVLRVCLYASFRLIACIKPRILKHKLSIGMINVREREVDCD